MLDLTFGSLQALFCSGIADERIVRAPFIIPEPPRPATARPTINMREDVATPHSNDPSSKRSKNEMNTYCISVNFNLRNGHKIFRLAQTFELNWPYSFPVKGCRVQLSITSVSLHCTWRRSNAMMAYFASRYALPYQPTSVKE